MSMTITPPRPKSSGFEPQPPFTIFVASNDRNGHLIFDKEKVQSALAWSIYDSNGTCIASDSSNGTCVKGRQGKATLLAVIEASKHTPKLSDAYVCTDVAFIPQILNLGIEGRRQRNYRRKDGAQLAYDDVWKALDAVLMERSQTLTGGRPLSDEHKQLLFDVKEVAARCTRNIDLPFRDWDI